jgi:hypothetical protein
MSKTKKDAYYLKALCSKDGQGSQLQVQPVVVGEPRPLSTPWQMVMALAALLDFASTLANRRFFLADRDAYVRIWSQNVPVPFSTMTRALVWLDTHSVPLGFWFSVLWCIEAFQHADRRAVRALRDLERRNIMAQLKTVLRRTSLISPHNNTGVAANTITAAWEQYKVWLMYYSSLMVQLLILPIGKCIQL